MGGGAGGSRGLYLLCGGGRTLSQENSNYNRHSPGQGLCEDWLEHLGALSPYAAGPCPLYGSVDAETQEGQNTPWGHTVRQEVSWDKKEFSVVFSSVKWDDNKATHSIDLL